jgi:hypothetical protein
MYSLACALARVQDFSESERLHAEADTLLRAILGENNLATRNNLYYRGWCLWKQGKLDQVEENFRRAYQGMRTTCTDLKATDLALRYLGLVLHEKGWDTEAQELIRQYCTQGWEIFGHPYSEQEMEIIYS